MRDRYLSARYGPKDLSGKAHCKKALQLELGLPVRREVPLIAMVGRLAEQKGIDLVAAALKEIVALDAQLVVLGSGEREYEQLFVQTAHERPGRLTARIGFDEALAHRIEGGADLFLMPSRFEPCGLNQMYSLRYGTVPIVHAVGGLEDTILDFDGNRSGNGFKFRDYHPRAMMTALRRALDVYRDGPAWRGIMLRGMAEDHSWRKSAEAYERLFLGLRARAIQAA